MTERSRLSTEAAAKEKSLQEQILQRDQLLATIQVKMASLKRSGDVEETLHLQIGQRDRMLVAMAAGILSLLCLC